MEPEFLLQLLHGFEAFKLLRRLSQRLHLRYRFMLRLARLSVGNEDYYPESCDDDRFNQILLLGDGFYQKATEMSESQSWARFRRNPDAFRCIIGVDKTTGDKRLAGYYAMFPLTKKATEAIQDHMIEGSRHLREEDICTSFSNFTSLYVSAVYGVDRFAQFHTTQFLSTAVLDHKDRRPRFQYVFTRPTTGEGCAIFKTLTGRDPEPGKIKRIDLDSDDLRKRYMERAKRIGALGRRRRSKKADSAH